MAFRSLSQARVEVEAAIRQRGIELRRVVTAVKALFVALAAAVAGVAQFVSWPNGQSPTAAEIVGIAATVVAFIGGTFMLLLDDDAGEQLSRARNALDLAARYNERNRRLTDQLQVVDRMIALYQATGVMRALLEQASVGSVGGLDDLMGSMLKVAGRQLAIASGFRQADRWTICVYRATLLRQGKHRLKCVAHHRAIETDLGDVREWPEGVGVAGIAFSNQREVIVDDLSDESVMSIFHPSGLAREYDDDRYRSIVAVPVMVQGAGKPWGVVVATNDQFGHFNHNDEAGLKPEEAIRALAGFTALAVALVSSRERAKSPLPAVKV